MVGGAPVNAAPLFSSAKADWTTPRWLFDRLDAEFNFTLDAAASPENALCPRYFTESDDALEQQWDGSVWVNPPYGRRVGIWPGKAWMESSYGAVVVMLLAARTDTKWFHAFCLGVATEIRFIAGRLRFGDSKDAAPFPSMVVVWDPRKQHPTAISTLKEKE